MLRGRWSPAVKRIALPLGLFLLALAVRALPWRTVFDGDRVLLFGNDAYYHLRRIRYTVDRFPALLEFDSYVNFPQGGQPIWPPLFDGLLAIVLRSLVGDDPLSIERAAVWVPPLLGALTVVVLFAIASRLFDRSVGATAGLLLALLSAHFWYSQIGFVDHHAAVALTSTLLLASALALVRTDDEGAAPARRRWSEAGATGASLALCLLVWPGSLLHVGLIGVGLSVHLLAQPTRETAIRLALQLAVVMGIAAVGVAPFALGKEWTTWGTFSPLVLSGFQPWLFASGFGLALGCAAVWRWTGAGTTRPRRWLSAGLLALLIAGAGPAAFAELRTGVAQAWVWFAKVEGFQASVGESAPLLVESGRFSFQAAELRLSRLFYVFPVALGAAAWWALKSSGTAPLRLLVWWSTMLWVATLVQLRFMNSFSVAMTLVVGWGCVALFRARPEAWRRSPARRAVVATASAVAMVFLCAPMLPTYEVHLWNLWNTVRGGPLVLTPRDLFKRSLVDVGRWLRDNTPPTAGYLDAREVPEYGVLSAWTLGHVLRYEAQRPMVRDNFGDDVGAEGYKRGRAYFHSSDEASAAAILDELRARYIVVYPLAWEGEKADRGSVFRRLYFHDGSEAGLAMPALARHRLVYESDRVPREKFPDQPTFKVYEYVAGAHVSGRAPPETNVEVQLSLWTNRGRHRVYQANAVTDAQGRYALRLPYATRGAPPSVRTHASYTVSCWRDSKPLVVDETAVRAGSEIAGPDLCR
jgi:dolichyl-diphosphooligosaccharide--protein glycosyltransferase